MYQSPTGQRDNVRTLHCCVRQKMQRAMFVIAACLALCFGPGAQAGGPEPPSQQPDPLRFEPVDPAGAPEPPSQEPNSRTNEGRAGYIDKDQLEFDNLVFGADRQLEVDDKITGILLPITKDPFQSWWDTKAKIYEETGLQFAFDYTILYMHATPSLAEKNALGQKARLYGQWELVDRDGPNTGQLVFRGESRTRLAGVAPQDLGTQAGYLGILGTFYSDDPINLTELFWEQRFADGYALFSLGHMYPARYLDTLGIGGPYDSFNNFSSLVNVSYDFTPPGDECPPCGLPQWQTLVPCRNPGRKSHHRAPHLVPGRVRILVLRGYRVHAHLGATLHQVLTGRWILCGRAQKSGGP